MESLQTEPGYTDTFNKYHNLLERKNSCSSIRNADDVVVVNLPFEQRRLFDVTSQGTALTESYGANTTSSQLISGITTVADACEQAFSIRAVESDSSSLPNMAELCRTEIPQNFQSHSDSITHITTLPQDPQLSCWQRWWQTVCPIACLLNKSERSLAARSSLVNCFRCCNFSSPRNTCCLGRSSSSRCNCRLSEWPRRRLPNENLLVLSIIQMLCGFASIILSSVALTKTVFLYQIAAGMWAGLLMLVTGTQGLITARRPISCTLIGLLIFCLLVTLASCALICISVAGIIEDGFLDRHATKLTTFQYRHITGQSSKQPSEQHYTDSMNMAMIFQPEGHISQMPMNWINGTNILRWARSRVNYDTRHTQSVDTNLRTCQVILHVLLLLVGIMESSVSLSTSAICYKCLYSWYSQSYLSGQGGVLASSGAPMHTSIISFNADTANQAASLLQSHDMQQFAHAGGVLLAVAANSQSGIQQDGNLSIPEESMSRPYIHHTTEPFLSDRKTGKALILTEAGSVATAWVAVQAAAALLNRDSASVLNDSPTHTDVLQTSHTQSFMPFWLSGNRNRNPSYPSRRDDRPRLLLTSLPSPQCHPPELSDTPGPAEESDTTRPNRRTTMLYVMPSPSREEPPMIFPPFPPPYSDLQRHPSSNPLRCSYPSDSHSGRSQHSRQSIFQYEEVDGRSQQTGDPHSGYHSYLGRLLNRLLRLRRRRQHRRSFESRTCFERLRQNTAQSTRASALICAGDRILQPVLIVEDSETITDPPSYSSLQLCPPSE